MYYRSNVLQNNTFTISLFHLVAFNDIYQEFKFPTPGLHWPKTLKVERCIIELSFYYVSVTNFDIRHECFFY